MVALAPRPATAPWLAAGGRLAAGPWLVSPRFDLAMVGLPALGTALVALAPNATGYPPLWAFLLLVVAVDVAHVWSTLYLSYLDREAFARRRLLFLLPIPVAVLVSWRLHLYSPELFWTLLAYFAIHHFAAQQLGFIALYRTLAGDRDPLDRRLDWWTLWVGALGPVVWWHASPDRDFDWFGNGEVFLVTLDPAVKPDILAVMVVVGGLWVGRQVWLARRGRLNPGKVAWMTAVWLSWAIGVGMAGHPLVSLAAINLLHGGPFLALVWRRCNHRWQGRTSGAASPVLAWLSQKRAVLAFYALVLCLGAIESGIWDWTTWGVYLQPLFGWETLTLRPPLEALLVGVLATPQIVHYYLDRWLWKLDGSNPDLNAMLGLRR
jgi:hypothetical protein